MSIIYDALKKVENKLESSGEKSLAADVKRVARKKPYYFYLVLVVAGITLASVVYNAISKHYLAKVVTIRATDQGPARLGKELALNGIFFSGDASYALINNQIVREGDAVMGVKIRRITSEVVELDKNGVIYRLSNRK